MDADVARVTISMLPDVALLEIFDFYANQARVTLAPVGLSDSALFPDLPAMNQPELAQDIQQLNNKCTSQDLVHLDQVLIDLYNLLMQLLNIEVPMCRNGADVVFGSPQRLNLRLFARAGHR
jgi:hypothetical protein